MKRRTLQIILLTIGVATVGCASTRTVDKPLDQEKTLALVMPQRIEIVEPFTGVASFDGDEVPDGIELVLQAVSSLGNPGMMIAGHLRVELFEHVKASADNRGRRVDHWEIPLSTVENQQTHWNNLTQMYEFRLGIATKPPSEGTKYVLTATYLSPMGQRLSTECIITFSKKSAGRGGFRR